jgi:DHA1 family inner membrane transport protein
MRILPLFALAFATFALGLGELMLAGILPAIASDIGVSIPLAGQLVTVYALTFAALSPPLAFALRNVNARRTLIASLVGVAIANAVAADGRSFALLLAARVLAAAGSAVATPLALGAVDRVTAQEMRGRAHGIVFTGFSLAAMLGVPLGALIATHFGWRWTFACVAVLALAAALGIAKTTPAVAAASPLPRSALRHIIRLAPLRRTLVISTLFMTAQYTYFAQRSGAGVDAVVVLLFVYGALGIAGTLIGGWTMDRYGTRPALLCALGGCTLGFVLLALVSSTFAGSVVAVALWALTAWGFGPVVTRRLDDEAGPARGIALALNLTAFNIGIAAGSAVGASVIIVSGVRALPLVAASLTLIAYLIGLRYDPRARRAPTSDVIEPPQMPRSPR